MNLMEPIFLSLFANIIRMYAIYRCMEHFFLSKDENKISKICMYTGFVLVNSVGYYLFNNMFINISTNIIGLLFAYSVRTAHPFRRNGAPFRFKLSKAQQVD